MNITVLGLTNPDVNLKRMHQLYNAVGVISKLNEYKVIFITVYLFHFHEISSMNFKAAYI